MYRALLAVGYTAHLL